MTIPESLSCRKKYCKVTLVNIYRLEWMRKLELRVRDCQVIMKRLDNNVSDIVHGFHPLLIRDRVYDYSRKASFGINGQDICVPKYMLRWAGPKIGHDTYRMWGSFRAASKKESKRHGFAYITSKAAMIWGYNSIVFSCILSAWGGMNDWYI